MSFSELSRKYNLHPSKNYGQNFLVSNAPIQKMIAAAELTSSDTVIEIGPGFGILTCAVAKKVKKVIVFEIEKKLQPYWEEKVKEYKNVEMVWGNVLKKFSVLSSKFSVSYKVIANIPYHITSDILRLFLEAGHKPERLVLMVQKEVASRICAKAGEMSLLSVAVQYYGRPKIVAKVARGSFWPAPKVDSAVIGTVEVVVIGGKTGVSQASTILF